MPNDQINPHVPAPGVANSLGIVEGLATGENGGKNGVYGSSVTATGVKGISIKGVGVYAESKEDVGLVAIGPRGAAVLQGAVSILGNTDMKGELQVSANLYVAGNINVKGDISLENADFAEDFDVIEEEDIQPGSVMVLDDNGILKKCDMPMDKRVAGVVSGAGIYKPGIILDRKSNNGPRVPIAMLGKVCCAVDASYGSIKVGDLLTTSPTSGAAMKVSNPVDAIGAIIGKALKPWSEGVGEIPILIALQ
ncbi:hypothetical protein [Flavihumibacter fluvii]|uniref:hypothetical protein n=1 Tax=Flavihumibacter fluvii TaxID=2838157 RepID=UPI001BDDEB23|nr:hypothetical protein [Flavihumibacter fluvii]ULQ51758.1 hypothetical protein KJS93_16850 [Flavihumibacter fluvii]